MVSIVISLLAIALNLVFRKRKLGIECARDDNSIVASAYLYLAAHRRKVRR